MYGQIISFLFVLLILYYIVMIFLDLQKAKAAKAAELEKNPEEDIDISDEASTFQPILITREEPQKPKPNENTIETEEKAGESTEQTTSKDYHQSETKESDKEKMESSVDKPSSESRTTQIPPVNPENTETPESEIKDKPKEENPQTYKREGYREALMTGAVPIDTIIQQVDEYAETGQGPLGEIIFECRSAHF